MLGLQPIPQVPQLNTLLFIVRLEPKVGSFHPPEYLQCCRKWAKKHRFLSTKKGVDMKNDVVLKPVAVWSCRDL